MSLGYEVFSSILKNFLNDCQPDISFHKNVLMLNIEFWNNA